MTKPATITQWLRQPASFSEEDRKMTASIVKAYPYFVPARYMEAADMHYNEPFGSSLMDKMLLYAGNWLLFHEFLQKSATPGIRQQITATPVAEDIIFEEEELQDDTINDYNDEFADDLSDFGMDDDTGDADEDPEHYTEEVTKEATPVPKQDTPQAKATGSAAVQPEHAAAIPPATKQERPAQQDQVPPVQTIPVEVKTIVPEPVTQEEKTTVLPVQPDVADPAPEVKKAPNTIKTKKGDSLIQPIYTEDYFLYQGIQVPDQPSTGGNKKDKDKSLMVVMSFSEWLLHFKTKGEREKEEMEDQKALKTMWQKEKLAAALEEENEEIPETVFEMAVNSITKEDDLASESLAEIMVKQGKYDKAIDMYRKLSLRNPQKNAYFARKIEALNKEKLS